MSTAAIIAATSMPIRRRGARVYSASVNPALPRTWPWSAVPIPARAGCPGRVSSTRWVRITPHTADRRPQTAGQPADAAGCPSRWWSWEPWPVRYRRPARRTTAASPGPVEAWKGLGTAGVCPGASDRETGDEQHSGRGPFHQPADERPQPDGEPVERDHVKSHMSGMGQGDRGSTSTKERSAAAVTRKAVTTSADPQPALPPSMTPSTRPDGHGGQDLPGSVSPRPKGDGSSSAVPTPVSAWRARSSCGRTGRRSSRPRKLT
ncbi:hypothetical protein QFZ22_001482 [Streptomyces canus]|uniref:Uncharacterized protein n=1 Tax=Streptomyces canus TaxID=58343 RepID=A0AAW8F9N8_9ACTN|nr:hypothetical protein [Streptomyces canus]